MSRGFALRRVAALAGLFFAVSMSAQQSAPAAPTPAQRLAVAESLEAESDRTERAAAVAPLPAPMAPVQPASATPVAPVPPPAAVAPAASPPPAAAVSSPQKAREILGEEQSYNAALALIRERAFAPAIQSLADFSGRFPQSKLLPNIAFWRAEIDFLEGHWELARVGFVAVTKNFPKHPKSADSWYKAALCSLKINDNMTAIGQLNEVLSRFPGSEAALLAEKKLAELSKKT